MKIRINSLAVSIGLIVILLVSCKTAEQHIKDVSGDTGVPPETVLLAFQVQARQGSQDACYFTSLFELYGSRLPIERIIDYYSTELTNNGWTEATPSWLPEEENDAYLLFQRDNAFQVVISEALPDDVDYLFDEIQEATEPYTTMYLVTFTYADRVAQRDCPLWQSESNK